MNASQTAERFFYHSFPRPRAGTDQTEKGLAILRSICRNGLLLVPERVSWRDPSAQPGTQPITAVQKRISFTELSPPELAAHAEVFGPFAIEYAIETLRALGALPVIYIPDAPECKEGTGVVGTTLLARIADALQVLDALASTQTFVGATLLARITTPEGEATGRLFNPGETAVIREYVNILSNGPKQPFPEIAGALRALSSLFYPTDDPRFKGLLGYYRQREWRLFSGGVIGGIPTSVEATPAQREELLAIDEDFFSRTLEFPNGVATLAERSHFMAVSGGQHVLALARSIIAPEEHREAAVRVLQEAGLDIPVRALESLGDRSA